MKRFKVIIAGSRTFNDYGYLSKVCALLLRNCKNIVVISGGANGADKLAEKYAKENGYPVEKFIANWNERGRSAGYYRNLEMAKNADALIAFWDGKSKGTKMMIDIANEYNLKIRVRHYTLTTTS